MKLDLAAVADQLKSRNGQVRAIWSGGQIEVNETEFISRVADAAATVMGQNLYKGLTPDGSAAMPGRKKDGKPRGQASNIARALASVSISAGVWLIAAHREIQGHLARIMQDVPLRAPPFSALGPAIRRAFERAVKTGKGEGSTPSQVAQALRQGPRQVWSGGKRVSIGKLFQGNSGAFDDVPSARLARLHAGRLARHLNGPRPAGPRLRTRRSGIGGYL